MNLYLRIHTVATAAVTWLVAASAVLTIVAEEIADAVGADSPVLVLIARAVVWLGVTVTIIRRVTPVLPEARGVLAKEGPVTKREDELTTKLIGALR